MITNVAAGLLGRIAQAHMVMRQGVMQAGANTSVCSTSRHVNSLIVLCRHFLELEAENGTTTAKLAAHQGRKTVAGIALHAIGAQVRCSSPR